VRTGRQSAGEEIANSVSHGIGFLAMLAATPVLILNAIPKGAASVVGVSIFAATVALLYLTSALYHAFPVSRAKRTLRVIDHAAIFLLIAGTYTPFTLGILRGAWGWTLFGLVWGLALAGIVFKVVGGLRYPRASTAIYVAMGWLVVIAIQPLLERMPQAGVGWLVAGGLAYTGGVVFYAMKGKRYSHFVWHLCVLAGTACHVIAVTGYSA